MSRFRFKAAAGIFPAAVFLFAGPLRAVVMGPEYTVDATAALVQALAASEDVTPTASADENFVVNTTPGSVAGDYGLPNPQIPPLPQYGLRITDADASGDKMKIVVIGGTHAREQSGSHMLDGFLRKLVEDSPEMRVLRAKADVYSYPQVNPKGRFGYNQPGNPHVLERDAPSNLGSGAFDEDLNRIWHAPAGWPQIVAIQQVIRADTGSQADLFLDFHARSFTRANLEGRTPPESAKQLWLHPDFVNTDFVQKLTARDPGIEIHPGSAVDDGLMTGAEWGRSNLGVNATESYTPECARDEPLAVYQDLGAVYALALYDLVKPPPPVVPDTKGASLLLDFNDAEVPGGDWVTLEALNADIPVSFPGTSMTGSFTARIEGDWQNTSSTVGQSSPSLAVPELAPGAADYLYVGGSDLEGTVTFSGLSRDLSYQFEVVASRSSAGTIPKTGTYTVNGQAADSDSNSEDDTGVDFDVVQDGYGQGDVLRWDHVRPDAQGRIVFRALSQAGSGSAGSNVYLNAIRLTEVLNYTQFLEAHPELQGPDAEGDADPDGDQWSNEEEMIIGTDPTDPLSPFTMNLGAGFVQLSDTRPGRTYQLEVSDDLTDPDSWTSFHTSETGTGGEVQIPISSETRFYRCVISL